MKRLALVGAATVALTLAVGAAANAAEPSAPIPGTLGFALSPAPLALDEGQRTVKVVNQSGGLALTVTLTPSEGYEVDTRTVTLLPEASAEVTLTKVAPDKDGTLTAVATGPATVGVTSSAISLTTRLNHQSFLESVGPLPFVLVFLALAATAATLVRRRISRDRRVANDRLRRYVG